MVLKNKFKFTTPVLFLVFNRLDTTKKVFNEIKKAKPKQLFIAADGPRNSEEKKKTDDVRKYILDNIDWECEIKTLFRDKNLGCKYACSSAIDWFFKNIEQGIILEDDCLPSQDFFRYCQEMLERYKDNNRIMHISGTNVMGKTSIKESYLFSKTYNVWGWATWRRAWKHYDVEMKLWPKYKNLIMFNKLRHNGVISNLKSWRIYNLTYNGNIDTWDYQWELAIRINKGLSIIPKVNMITNMGIGGGTHTVNYGDEKMVKTYNLKFPLIHKRKIIENKYYYKKFKKFFSKSLFNFILNKK